MMEVHSLEELRSGKIKAAKRITLSNALTSFPEEIFEHTDTLEILDLSNNLLTEIPESILLFKKLKILFLSNNCFTEFPLVLGRSSTLTMIGFKSNQINVIPENAFPVNLQWLILTNNRIHALPSSIGNCIRLQKVALAGNNLTQLPEEMANCKNLELLRISANQLETLPGWLLTLPKLAWLAYSGNPCTDTLNVLKPLPLINWQDFSIGEKLGEGASGIISKAILSTNSGKEKKTVAVKVFKGEVTSDGYPEDEMNVSAIIPVHRNLVTVIGKIYDHPENKNGLIFELIPATYYNLAMPPSFESCSRDTFKEGTTFSVSTVLKIANSIASAAMQLHKNGIMHGDLYAHNTLIDEHANTLFGDFGAATPYTPKNPNAALIERIEVRAFGYFIDDLLQHLIDQEKQSAFALKLIELKEQCLFNEVLLRPDFKFVNAQLEKLLLFIS